VLFVEIQLDTGTERFHTGLGEITWGGQVWYGAGQMAAIEELAETIDLTPDAIRLGLNGFDPDVSDLVDTAEIYRRPVIMYLGAFNESYVLVADPDLVFSGYAEDLETSWGGEDGDSAMLTAESELRVLTRPRNLRYTDAQLQDEYSGDLGLEYLEQTKDAKTVWRGRQPTRLGGGSAVTSTTSGGRTRGSGSIGTY
jgi:hypothetical protein